MFSDTTRRTKSFLAHEWQIKEIKKGLAEADAGELIDHEHIVKKWKNYSPFTHQRQTIADWH